MGMASDGKSCRSILDVRKYIEQLENSTAKPRSRKKDVDLLRPSRLEAPAKKIREKMANIAPNGTKCGTIRDTR